MADVDPGRDYRLNVRGVYEDLGDRVPRGYVEVLAGERSGLATKNSGRLELADLVASPANPLTARVFVNRVWYWIFGTGIVRTTEASQQLCPRRVGVLVVLERQAVDDRQRGLGRVRLRDSDCPVQFDHR